MLFQLLLMLTYGIFVVAHVPRIVVLVAIHRGKYLQCLAESCIVLVILDLLNNINMVLELVRELSDGFLNFWICLLFYLLFDELIFAAVAL